MNAEKDTAIDSKADIELVEFRNDERDPQVLGPPSYTPEEEKRVKRKVDFIMLPLLCFMNLCSFLDKSNIGNANTAGMSVDLGITTEQYNLLLTVFYVVYTLCQWEFLLLKYIPARWWMGGIVLCWGLASCLQGITTSLGGMMACRVVVAALEAGGGPAVAFYISLLWPRSEFGLRWTIFQVTSCLANAFAGAMAYGLVQVKSSIPVWKLVFIVESVPTFVSGILLLIFLPTTVDKCIFLTKRENEVALERLQRGSSVDTKRGYSYSEFFRAFLDPWTWLIGLIHFFGGAAFNSLSVFLTAIVRDMGYTSINAQGLVAPAWIFAYVVAITGGYLSDKYSVRGWIIAIGQLVGAAGYLTLAFAPSIGARYFAVYITVAGVYMAQPIMFSWVAVNGETDSKRAAALVLFLVTGQCGSILGSNIYNDAPRYLKGNTICAAGLIVNVFLSIFGIYYLQWRNKKKDAQFGVPAEGAVITVMEDGSPHPAWRFKY